MDTANFSLFLPQLERAAFGQLIGQGQCTAHIGSRKFYAPALPFVTRDHVKSRHGSSLNRHIIDAEGPEWFPA